MSDPPPGRVLPIIQYWHSGVPPADVAELIATFPERNPDLRHLVFCQAQAAEFISEHLTPREAAAFATCAVPAMQADYLRYCAAFVLGGICSDADFRCMRPLRPLLDTDGNALLFNGPAGQDHVITGFFLFKSPGHPLLRLVLDVATAQIEWRTMENVWSVTGPWIFSALSILNRLGTADGLRREIAERAIETSPEPLLRVVGDPERAIEAFDGVRTLPFERTKDWIGSPTRPPRYKESEVHWTIWQKRTTIFRSLD